MPESRRSGIIPGVFGDGFDDVRAATTHDLGALADEVVDVTKALELVDDERAEALLLDAVTAFERAERLFDKAEDPNDFAEVTAAIGRGRYLLARCRARLDRSPEPVEQPCFFDPAHGPAERLVAWAPPEGDPRTVPACAVDAELVEGNLQPEPRRVAVAKRLVPYWNAPVSFVPWFSGYFESVEGCAAADLLAGMPLGDELAGTVDPGRDRVVTSTDMGWLTIEWPDEED